MPHKNSVNSSAQPDSYIKKSQTDFALYRSIQALSEAEEFYDDDIAREFAHLNIPTDLDSTFSQDGPQWSKHDPAYGWPTHPGDNKGSPSPSATPQTTSETCTSQTLSVHTHERRASSPASTYHTKSGYRESHSWTRPRWFAHDYAYTNPMSREQNQVYSPRSSFDSPNERRRSISTVSSNSDALREAIRAKKNDNRNGSSSRRRSYKFNSCSSLFVEGTISKTSVDRLLRSISFALHTKIASNVTNGLIIREDQLPVSVRPSTAALCEFLSFSSSPSALKVIPCEEGIFQFLRHIFHAVQLTADCAVITLIYLDRLLLRTGIPLLPRNWLRLLFGALVIAVKVWDDQAVWNVDFCGIFPNLCVQDVNDLERWYFDQIDYDVSVKASDYARYFFDLFELMRHRSVALTGRESGYDRRRHRAKSDAPSKPYRTRKQNEYTIESDGEWRPISWQEAAKMEATSVADHKRLLEKHRNSLLPEDTLRGSQDPSLASTRSAESQNGSSGSVLDYSEEEDHVESQHDDGSLDLEETLESGHPINKHLGFAGLMRKSRSDHMFISAGVPAVVM